MKIYLLKILCMIMHNTYKIFLVCVQIRIWARRTAIEQGQGNYALNVTGPILDFFQLYYNISYPLSKSGEPAFTNI